MIHKIYFIFIFLIFFAEQAEADQRDSTLKAITYPFAGLADDIKIEKSPLSDRLKQLGLELPDRLQSKIINRNVAGIIFLERNESEKIKKVIDYENVTASDKDIFRVVPETGNTVLFTNISRPQIGLVKIDAKLVSLKSEIIAKDEVVFETRHLMNQDSLEAKINQLADSIIQGLPKILPDDLPIKKRKPLLSKLTFVSGITVAGSAAWYIVQDKNLSSTYGEYQHALTEQEAATAWNETETQLNKRNVVRAILITSASALALSAIYDLFIGPEYGIYRPSQSNRLQMQANIVDRNSFALHVTYRF